MRGTFIIFHSYFCHSSLFNIGYVFVGTTMFWADVDTKKAVCDGILTH